MLIPKKDRPVARTIRDLVMHWKLSFAMTGALLFLLPVDAQAGRRGNRYQSSNQPMYQPASQPGNQAGYGNGWQPPVASTSNYQPAEQSSGDDALAEVNAQRASRGLRPFIRDEGLTQAARACAT